MHFRLTLCLFNLLLRLSVLLIQNNKELLDCFGWLLVKLGYCPPELFAEPINREGWVRFVSSDGFDKKRVSSGVTVLRRFAI
jgi:hypothetical protein